MGPVVARSWLACLAMVCAACSLVVDFPDHPPAQETQDGGLDGGPRLDSSADARGDTQAPAPDSSDGTSCKTHAGCDSDQLCCPNMIGALECVATGVLGCIDCGLGCSDPRAPNCSNSRTCECVAGTNKGCDQGQMCNGSGPTATCGECAGDADCAMKEGKTFCEAGKCVACRGSLGCSGRTPICSNNTCIGCDDSAPATSCPAGLTCSPGLGCGGCKADQAIVGANGCMPESTTPICKADSAGLTTCQACTTNTECKFQGGQGYCATGRCSNICDGDSPPGNNGCVTPAKPLCKPASNVAGGYDCAACVEADCTPTNQRCATAGTKAGSCVQCLTSADCKSGLAPVCDATTFACRARTAADCVAPTPVLSGAGECVECTLPQHCAGSAKGTICVAGKNVCGQCNSNADCPAAAPTCNPTTSLCELGCTASVCLAQPVAKLCNAVTNQCVQCATDAQCPVGATPLCSSGFCAGCDAVAGTVGAVDALCDNKTRGTSCVRAGMYKGWCAQCGAGIGTCLGNQSCTAALVCQ